MSKERPILFSGPMVRALLDGSKTQTRRIVKGKALEWLECFNFTPEFVALPDNAMCPYGHPGDRLWVREAFDFLPSGGPDQPQACEIVYWATGSTEPRSAPLDYNPMIYGHQKVRPSIHMPRWASRITLEVTSVRVERLQDISEADAKAEGITPHIRGGWHWLKHDSSNPCDWNQFGYKTAALAFQALWESINGPDSWATNPWVWAIEFRRLP